MSWRFSQRLMQIGAMFAVALGVTAARAEAQIPAADGQFHACVRVDRDGEDGRLMRLVAETEPCRKNETRIQWSAAGSPGAQGPQGLQGPQGVPGADGTNAARAAGPCFATTRYIDCGNGTVTDSVTGLIWLKQADCLPDANYVNANVEAAGLKDGDCGLTDGSSPGDWRLPTADEWKATLASAIANGCTTANGAAPTLTDSRGFGCMSTSPFGTPFIGVRPNWYATSVTYPGSTRAYYALLDHGVVNGFGFANVVGVWPVRSPR